MSDCGIMSRRAAEKAIERGEIEINGIKAKIGDKIDEANDAVTYRGVLRQNAATPTVANVSMEFIMSLSCCSASIRSSC